MGPARVQQPAGSAGGCGVAAGGQQQQQRLSGRVQGACSGREASIQADRGGGGTHETRGEGATRRQTRSCLQGMQWRAVKLHSCAAVEAGGRLPVLCDVDLLRQTLVTALC